MEVFQDGDRCWDVGGVWGGEGSSSETTKPEEQSPGGQTHNRGEGEGFTWTVVTGERRSCGRPHHRPEKTGWQGFTIALNGYFGEGDGVHCRCFDGRKKRRAMIQGEQRRGKGGEASYERGTRMRKWPI